MSYFGGRITELMAFPIPHMTEVFDMLAESTAEVSQLWIYIVGFGRCPLRNLRQNQHS